MKKIIQFLIIVFAFNINAKIEVLDRVAVIVDDGVIMESQIKNTILDIQRRYEDQNIPMPPMEILLDQAKFFSMIFLLNFHDQFLYVKY